MKAQINKSEIFKAAWSLVKTAGKSLSEALKAAWAKAKQSFLSFPELVSLAKGEPNKHRLISNSADYQNILAMCKASFKTLEGSEKQVKWAESLRDKMVANIAYIIVNNALCDALDALRRYGRTVEYLVQYGDASFEKAVAASKIIAYQTKATYFINNRDNDYSALAAMMNK